MTADNTDNRLVIVSNRVAGDRPPVGGLVFALHDCLTAQGGVWIGTAAQTTEKPAPHLHHHKAAGYDRYLMDLTSDDHQSFYLGYANAVLWPLCHGRTDLMEIRRGQYEGYRRVNARLAAQIAAILQPSDVVWIHDYHFFPLAYELRALRLRNRIGFFLHIPFPAGHDLHALSQGDALIDWLSAYDVIGLQSARDVAQFMASARLYPATEILRSGKVRIGDRAVSVRAFPIGIDVAAMQENAGSGSEAVAPTTDKMILGIDRLDYSKGLPQRFDAFEHFLATREPEDPQASLLQVAPISRAEVSAYQQIRRTLEQKAGAINGAYGTPDWVPIRYIAQNMDRANVARLYRQASVGLVTPLIDGMNLVAKEFVAAQDPSNPGVLVLSRLAGAAEQMAEALLVNPYDPTDIGGAIRKGLRMPLAERKARHAVLLAGIEQQDVHWWTQSYLRHLMQTEAGQGLRALA